MTRAVDVRAVLDDAALSEDGAPSSRSTISYVFPVFNEEGNLRLLLERVAAVTESLAPTYDVEVVVVNDGGTAHSAHVLAEPADADGGFVFMTSPGTTGTRW